MEMERGQGVPSQSTPFLCISPTPKCYPLLYLILFLTASPFPNAPASVSSTLGQISPEMLSVLQPILSKLSSASLSNIVSPFSNAFYIDLQNSSSIPLDTVAFNTPDDLHTLQSSNFL
jgi:hypothetical protein